MRNMLLAATASLAVLSAPAIAQDTPDPWLDTTVSSDDGESAAGRLAESLRDPATQDRLAGMVAVMSQVLLDLPIGPLAEAAAEATGEDMDDIDPDMTVRDIAPGSEELPEEIADKLPRMMDSMGAMAGGLEAMLPALRAMAEQMEGAMEDPR